MDEEHYEREREEKREREWEWEDKRVSKKPAPNEVARKAGIADATKTMLWMEFEETPFSSWWDTPCRVAVAVVVNVVVMVAVNVISVVVVNVVVVVVVIDVAVKNWDR